MQNITKIFVRRQTKRLLERSLSTSPYAKFEMAPSDPIVGLNEIFNKDDFPLKQIVGVGSYRDDSGRPYVLPCVRKAEQIMLDQNLDMEYTGIVRFQHIIQWMNIGWFAFIARSRSLMRINAHPTSLSLSLCVCSFFLLVIGRRTEFHWVCKKICVWWGLFPSIGESYPRNTVIIWYGWITVGVG
jgi:hypothetical protein